MEIQNEIKAKLTAMNDTQLRTFINELEPWCRNVRQALNTKTVDTQRATTQRKKDGSTLSETAKQEILDTLDTKLHGITVDAEHPGLLNTFPLLDRVT